MLPKKVLPETTNVVVLGKPLVPDECTTQRLRISYARMLVEIDITQEMNKQITISDNEGNELIQSVEYE